MPLTRQSRLGGSPRPQCDDTLDGWWRHPCMEPRGAASPRAAIRVLTGGELEWLARERLAPRSWSKSDWLGLDIYAALLDSAGAQSNRSSSGIPRSAHSFARR